MGRDWFLRDRSAEAGLPVALIRGQPAGAEEAVKLAADLLAKARAPLILGLSGAVSESVAAALALGDRIGAAIEPGDARVSLPRLLALQRVGRVTATLGEVRNRADVVVFWGADPVVTHPRHWERYSVEPRGRFTPDGRGGRTVIVVDRERTRTADQADQFVKIDDDQQFEILWILRALVQGLSPDPARLKTMQDTGPSLEALRHLANALAKARYGAFFHGSMLEHGTLAEAEANLEAASGLVRDLNTTSRFVMLGLGAPGNVAGAEAVLTRQTGFPASVDLSAGYPASVPGVSSALDRLSRGEVDLALIVGELSLDGFDESARAQLGRVPRIVLAPPGSLSIGLSEPDVRLNTSTPGLDEEGTVMRVDGVSLPLRPVLPSTRPSAGAWLESILARLGSVAGA